MKSFFRVMFLSSAFFLINSIELSILRYLKLGTEISISPYEYFIRIFSSHLVVQIVPISIIMILLLIWFNRIKLKRKIEYGIIFLLLPVSFFHNQYFEYLRQDWKEILVAYICTLLLYFLLFFKKEDYVSK